MTDIKLIVCAVLILIMYISALAFIFSDLWSGIRKAKKNGTMRTSGGYKRTIDKVAKYFNMLIALSVVDVVQLSIIFAMYRFYACDLIMLPWFTFLGACYIGFVEVKSILEPADVKERKNQEDFKNLVMNLADCKNHPERAVEVLQKIINEMKGDKEDKQ